jgi:hypothetical protein
MLVNKAGWLIPAENAKERKRKMKNEWNYIPVFKDNAVLMKELSDEDFGRIIRAAITDCPTDRIPEGFTDVLFMFYKIFMSQVERVFAERESRIYGKKQSGYRQKAPAPNDKYSEIDPEEALRLALERTFGDDDEG